MKKIITVMALLSLFGIPETLYATLLPLRDAGSLSRGTLDPNRVSPDTFTLQGNNFSISGATANVDARIKDLIVFRSTAQITIDGFRTFRSTAETSIDGFAAFRSTTEPWINGLNVFRSTASPTIDGLLAFKSTAEPLLGGLNVFRSTVETRLDSFLLSTNTLAGASTTFAIWNAVQKSTNSLSAGSSSYVNIKDGQIYISSMTSYGTITTTSGFIGGGSTFTTTNVNVIIFADGTSMNTKATGGGGAGTFGVFDEDAYVNVAGSINIRGTNAAATVVGGTMVITISGGGGLTKYPPKKASQGTGDLYLSTSAGSAGWSWMNAVDTVTIVGVQPYCIVTSTLNNIFNIARSTEIGATNTGYEVIHASSFTLPANQKYGVRTTTITPICTILPYQNMILYVGTTTLSGNLPSDCGLCLEYTIP